MASRGKLVAIEGIDGSGKRTQIELLAGDLDRRAISFSQISFPVYGSFFGKMVARFLNGGFGPLEAVDPHFSALLYAGNRLESKPRMEASLDAGKIVLADRYVGSNLAHQASRMPRDKRDEFQKWLRQLEYEVYGLPAEDLVIYLRVPPAEAQRLAGERAGREYTSMKRDLQESSLAHLEAASAAYDQLALQPPWVRIECFDEAAHSLRSPAVIHEEVVKAMDARICSSLQAKG